MTTDERACQTLLANAELIRIEISKTLVSDTKSELAQYLTPAPVAAFMASLCAVTQEPVKLLDPGSGTGILTAALVESLISREVFPPSISADLYEVDQTLHSAVNEVIALCGTAADRLGILFSGKLIDHDFVEAGSKRASAHASLFAGDELAYSHCIMNPPYKKIRSDSKHRMLLRQIGIETSNLYTAFLALAIRLLLPSGELVAIVPRSFCNGTYFRPFRQMLLEYMSLDRIHVFEARDRAFQGDGVLQENVILHATKHAAQGKVVLSTSYDTTFEDMTERAVEFEELVNPDDAEMFIRVVAHGLDAMVVNQMRGFTTSLKELGIEVSTGPVVDFRLKLHIEENPTDNTCPLIYPSHFSSGFVEWPKPGGRKPNAIILAQSSIRWLMENGWYVLTRRFSSKEERRRVVAAIHDPKRIPGELVGFENHLNVFHAKKVGLSPDVARGLAVYLNSTLVDLHFRQFSGHTQVNATDLRSLRYPDLAALRELGQLVDESFPSQEDIDRAIGELVSGKVKGEMADPSTVTRRIDQALEILRSLGMPRGQQNERSALTFLALLALSPTDEWADAGAPLMGITPIMEFMSEHYGKNYAPNTRETVRRQTIHQFVDAAIAVINPDDPSRSTNSPKTVYQIESNLLGAVSVYGTDTWEQALKGFLSIRPSLAGRYAKQRDMQQVPVEVEDGAVAHLAPGDHSDLIKAIIEEFGSRFVREGVVLYIGDTGNKTILVKEEELRELGIEFDRHGKWPDVILYACKDNWLFLVEAVTSHGPVDPKRHSELEALLKGSLAEHIYVTAFPNRTTMAKYLPEISWETEVWVSESPSHLIHFDGERFLGPY